MEWLKKKKKKSGVPVEKPDTLEGEEVWLVGWSVDWLLGTGQKQHRKVVKR